MRFDNGDDRIDPGVQPLRAFAQHLEGLADARGGAEEDPELALPLTRGGAEQRIGRRAESAGAIAPDQALSAASATAGRRCLWNFNGAHPPSPSNLYGLNA